MKSILAADIGGTNSRFGHFEVDESWELTLMGTQWVKTKDSSSFQHLLTQLYEHDFSLQSGDADIVVIAIAGPVEGGVYCSPPFISWDIDVKNARSDFGFKRSYLINDFVAQAFACRSVVGQSAEEILPGNIVHDAPIAVIGAGTALGKAVLITDGSGGFVAVPSEGGHTNFPFVSEQECRFQDFLTKEIEQEYIIANYVVSGRGISLIHKFLTGEHLEPRKVTEMFSGTSETLQWASRFYGRACRNYVLETLALGGVYIAGGVAAKAPILLTHDAFEREFRSSRTMSELLKDVPVFLIRNEESGLWGAAFYGKQQLEKSK